MILPLEQQVCGLEYAKRLNKLGCPQESLFYQIEYPDGKAILVDWLQAKKEEVNIKSAQTGMFVWMWGRPVR